MVHVFDCDHDDVKSDAEEKKETSSSLTVEKRKPGVKYVWCRTTVQR